MKHTGGGSTAGLS
ncbi:unnamed protein product, partial [Arabidopsis lyrata]